MQGGEVKSEQGVIIDEQDPFKLAHKAKSEGYQVPQRKPRPDKE
jgi:hypothetical protein